ncbi:hypothetical protein Poly24_31280 [Rosistilla carotiformis]|uniref:Uncharacterized protein n=1 Tax=Rosistilla carotiformis TaxID=2528017 RepID=A0A518JV40_9BACT|nr:hypothetical protein Poly24_31280 [Rosistilla carotiformis]
MQIDTVALCIRISEPLLTGLRWHTNRLLLLSSLLGGSVDWRHRLVKFGIIGAHGIWIATAQQWRRETYQNNDPLSDFHVPQFSKFKTVFSGCGLRDMRPRNFHAYTNPTRLPRTGIARIQQTFDDPHFESGEVNEWQPDGLSFVDDVGWVRKSLRLRLNSQALRGR